MGRGGLPRNPYLKKPFEKPLKRTEQGALFATSPAMLYRGTGKDTILEKAFIFNDRGQERVLKYPTL